MVKAFPPLAGNYLRVRGEYQPQPRPGQCRRELPPRARRIQKQMEDMGLEFGTTSACAENTHGEMS